MSHQNRDQVFISYSHKDKEWLEQLRTMLKPLTRSGTVTVWDDKLIRAGDRWREKIEEALASAKVAVLLVSDNFLDSDFIAEHELPPLLKAAEGEGLIILWIPLSHCLYEETEISNYQAVYNPQHPLDTLSQSAQKEAFATICREIKKAAGTHVPFSLHANAVASSPHTRLTINLPSHNRIFTGREDVLSALKVELETTRRAALSGMPGVGKTQTATEYAHRQYAAQTYDYIIYARAATETELLTDFVSAAQLLRLPAKDAADFNLVAAAVRAWLEGAEKWLLIFDNADDLAVVRSHLPANPRGHVILTRRPDNAGNVARTIRIDRMEADEGALLLLRRAELIEEAATTLDAVAPESAEAARAISREMYGLPLSLDIAGAYINETKKPLEGYLTLYRQQGKRLRQRLDKDDPYKKSVAQAFLLTMEQMALPDHDEEASAVIARAAVDLLRLCAFLAPDAIPLDLIAAAATNWGDDLNRVRGDEIWWDETKAKATRFSLLSAASQADAAPQAQTYDTHREVQAVVRDEMDDETQRLWAERNLQSLAAAFPDAAEFANWEACDLFLPHLQACLEHGDKLNIETETVASLKSKTGFHLNSSARYAEASRCTCRRWNSGRSCSAQNIQTWLQA
jgi:hypothetical protein